MQYCLVEDENITDGPRALPKSWRNVSGLDLASAAELKDKGWLPYTETLATVGKYEVYVDTTYVVSTGGVAGVQNKRDMTDAEKAEKDSNNAKDKIWELEYLETPRRLAEAVLTAEGKTWLQSSRDAIEAARAKL